MTGGIVAVLFGLLFPWLLERALSDLAVGRARRARRAGRLLAPAIVSGRSIAAGCKWGCC